MPRKPRIEYPGAFYHVLARGNQRQDIFLEEKDYSVYLKYLQDYQRRFGFLLYAYVLMKNHFHLLLEVGSIPLSKIMQALQYRYTRYFNRSYQKSGHLFQGRYKAILCDKDAYLLELVRYLHLNSLRAGIAKRPEEYPWSSHLQYLNTRPVPWLKKELVLAQLGEDPHKAIRAYSQFIQDGMGMGHREEFYQVKEQRFLGDDSFIEDSEKRQRKVYEKENWDIPLEVLVNYVSSQLKVGKGEIYTLSRNRQGAWARSLVTYLARELSEYPLKELATFLRRDPTALSIGQKKVEELLVKDPAFEAKMRRWKEELIRGRKRKYKIIHA
ncbi:MAG: transposase [candidate division NC10 bacterium]|nr:transposase [candidate division NC10 bacterium]